MSTLYMAGYDTHITCESHHLLLSPDKPQPGKPTRRIPLHAIDRMAVVGNARVSMAVVRHMLHHQKAVGLVSPTGRWVGAFVPERDGDAEVRIRQYRRANDMAWRLTAAQMLVQAKLMNQRRVLQKTTPVTDADSPPAVEREIEELENHARHAAAADDLDALRGCEGAGTAAYFRALRTRFPAAFPFPKRNRRPPRDPVNALLSWTYTMVLQELYGAVRLAGLDPCIGALHGISYGRPSLALDLLEPLRAPLCDLFVLRLFNLTVLRHEHFETEADTGACLLNEGGRRLFFEHYEKRMQRPFKLRGQEAQTTIRTIMADSVADYARALCEGQALHPFRMP